MSTIERQVRKAQHRLWANRWLRNLGWSLLAVTAGWLALWLVDRLLVPGLVPKGWSAAIAAGLSLLLASVCLALRRDSALAAAAALDEAARLKERVSTGLEVQARTDDSFAQAVVVDAEHAVTGLSTRRFIPLRWTPSLSYGAVMIGAALLSLLLPEFDLLNRNQAQATDKDRAAELRRVQAVVAQPLSRMREIEQQNPDLKADETTKKFDDPLARQEKPDADVVRREALKKLDRLQEALKQKAASERFKALDETKKRLKQVADAADPKTELGLLTQALADGDFNEAQKSLAKVREDLAKRAREGKVDAKTAEQMQKQLNEIAKKLQEAAEDKQSARELQNAGLSPEDAKRVLEALAKKDPEQLEKLAKELAERLKSQGMTQEQMKEMLQKMQQRQEACSKCEGLGQKMSGAAKQLEQGNLETAEEELAEAGEMLDETEQLEQSLNDIESQMAELNDLRDQMNNSCQGKPGPCQRCKGTGFLEDGSPCPHCKGHQGSGVGKGGKTDPRDDSVKTDTVDKKSPTKSRKGGAIIGQQFIKGKMLTGQSEAEFYDAAQAAELQATDALNKERIPRIYRRGVKAYFDRLGNAVRPAGKDAKGGAQDGSKTGKDESSTSDGKPAGDAGSVGASDKAGAARDSQGGGDSDRPATEGDESGGS